MFEIKKAILLVVLFSHIPAFGRLASMQEAHVRSKLDFKIFVEADGKEKRISHQELTLLTEAARQANATLNLTYFSNGVKFEVVKSEAHHPDGKIDYVDLSSLTREKNPGTSQLIDDSMSISIPFPNVQIGSTLVIETIETDIKMPIPGCFSFTKNFDNFIYSQDSRIDVSSKIPLFFEIKEESLWEVIVKKRNGEYPYQYHFRMKEDYFHLVISEEDSSPLQNGSTRIIISNQKTFSDIYQNVAAAFEREGRKSTQDSFLFPL